MVVFYFSLGGTSMIKVSPKQFLYNVLSGVAIAIVAGLIPNAILGELFKLLHQNLQYLQLYCKLWKVFNLQFLY